MTASSVYLDYNATAPLRPEARAAIEAALGRPGNASSVHAFGRQARALVEEARERVARLAGAPEDAIVFTSGGTEANVLALGGAVMGAAEAGTRITRLFVSAIEHPSVRATAAALVERMPGAKLYEIPAGADGRIAVRGFEELLREGKGRALAAIMAANNETGVVQPLAELIAAAKAAGALVLVDAVQAAGKIPFDAAGLGADYVTLSSHKIGGPQGAGALVLQDGAPFAAQLLGGGQERGRRAGTENVAAIAGFGAAAQAAGAQLPTAELRDVFEAKLREGAPDAVIFGEHAPRLPNTSNFAVPGVTAETAMIALDLEGVALSSGAACSSGKVKRSHVLEAMGVAPDLAGCALRASFGWASTMDDVTYAVAAIGRVRARARARAA